MEAPESRCQAGKRIGLRLIEEEWRCGRSQATQAEDGRALVDADKAAPDEGLQRGGRQLLAAQLGQGQLIAAGRQLGQNGLLLLSQRREPRLGNQHGKPFHPARIALGGGGLADNPFFARQAGEDRQRGRGSGAQRGDFDRLARGQTDEHAVLQVLLFGRELPAPFRRTLVRETGCPRACPELVEGSGFSDLGVCRVPVHASRQHVAAQAGDAVVDGAADLGHERQHAAQHLAQRGQVILGHPLGQREQAVAEQRFLIQHRLKEADLKIRRRFGVEAGDHPDQLFLPERHDHARAPLRKLPLAHRVGERAVQRHGQCDFAVGGHGRQESV